MTRSCLVGVSMFALMAMGCANPAADQPKAEVKDAPVPVTAPAPEKTVSDGKTDESTPNTSTIALNASNTTLGFVGAKVTGSHEGKFETVTGKITYTGADPTTAKVDVSIDMASLKTGIEKLDGHLKSPDFFDVAKFPTATFVSTAIIGGAGDAAHTVTGTLDLHGVKKQISFPVKLDISDTALKANATFSINRKDFGIVFPGMPDDLIRDDVVIKITVDTPLG